MEPTIDGEIECEQSFLATLFGHPILTREEQDDLVQRAQGGDLRARNRLVEHAMRFVRRITRSYQEVGHSRMDFLQEGAIGVMNALRWHEPARGSSFLNFAAKQIRKSSLCAVRAQEGVFPSQRRSIREQGERTVSFNSTVHQNRICERALAELIPDKVQLSVEHEVELRAEARELHRFLRGLGDILRLAGCTGRQRECFIRWYGIGETFARETLDAIGPTRQAAQDVVRRAQEKLFAHDPALSHELIEESAARLERITALIPRATL